MTKSENASKIVFQQKQEFYLHIMVSCSDIIHAVVLSEIIKDGYRLWPTLPSDWSTPDPIGSKNINLVKDLRFLLAIKFDQIPFSSFGEI